ncbi:hypothetical protein B0H14DRAFT_3531480 [Mycena olivaceomarginata]|nr:hypothetical protein B0H14DRAFT_3531480 [Mycena olivaceomarginata]
MPMPTPPRLRVALRWIPPSLLSVPLHSIPLPHAPSLPRASPPFFPPYLPPSSEPVPSPPAFLTRFPTRHARIKPVGITHRRCSYQRYWATQTRAYNPPTLCPRMPPPDSNTPATKLKRRSIIPVSSLSPIPYSRTSPPLYLPLLRLPSLPLLNPSLLCLFSLLALRLRAPTMSYSCADTTPLDDTPPRQLRTCDLPTLARTGPYQLRPHRARAVALCPSFTRASLSPRLGSFAPAFFPALPPRLVSFRRSLPATRSINGRPSLPTPLARASSPDLATMLPARCSAYALGTVSRNAQEHARSPPFLVFISTLVPVPSSPQSRPHPALLKLASKAIYAMHSLCSSLPSSCFSLVPYTPTHPGAIAPPPFFPLPPFLLILFSSST